jgi:DNA-binding NarL/FixJ family response regulator
LAASESRDRRRPITCLTPSGILRLIAAGSSNGEIANELILSVVPVARHVTNIAKSKFIHYSVNIPLTSS